jgi:ADP-ribose pyrophosphatase
MSRPGPDTPIETRWEGRFITVKQQGHGNMSRARAAFMPR